MTTTGTPKNLYQIDADRANDKLNDFGYYHPVDIPLEVMELTYFVPYRDQCPNAMQATSFKSDISLRVANFGQQIQYILL